VWTDWEAFAQYAFNKSHATCYAYLANQTAYLKTHYAPEFMASILTHNSGNIDQITFFMDECKRMGLVVKGPDINESIVNFSVNKKGEIRFGLGAIKGLGDSATVEIINQRVIGGTYSSIFDLTSRANLRTVNKKSIEALALAGAFDSWGVYNRSQYMEKAQGSLVNGIEIAIKYGGQVQDNKVSNQNSLFGESSNGNIQEPKLPFIEEWNPIEKLNKEKEVAGMFISGHPLDDFKMDMDLFTNTKISDLSDLNLVKGKEIKIGGIVTLFEERVTKTGKPWAKFTLEDYSGAKEFALFGKDFATFRPFLQMNAMLYGFLSIATSYRDPNELELKFNKISYLADLRETNLKSIQLQMKTTQVNKETLEHLLKLTKEHKGPATLKICIKDPETNHQTELFSRQIKIDWNPIMRQELELMDIGVKVN
jgi:DNA polymerase-3 subunit alpha